MRKVFLEKDQKRIAQMFNRISTTYDLLNHLLSGGMDIWWRHKAVSSVGLSAGQKILDVATGTGDLAFAALKSQPQTCVIGIDIAELMLLRAKRKRKSKGIDRESYQLVAGDATSLPFIDSSFDAVICAYGIRNMAAVGKAIEEFYRVLKPGGKLLILEFGLPRNPCFRAIYLFYFEKILPAVGGLIAGDQVAYKYLPNSVETFITANQLAEQLAPRFKVMLIQHLLGGITYFLKAVKQDYESSI